jgi:hypothetical protein
MGRLLRIVVGLLLVASACSTGDDDVATRTTDGSPVAAELPDLAARFVGAVFRVETEGCGWLGSGSGFAIDAHHVVTNHHVVANDSSPVVRAQDGHAITGRVIGSTDRPDLAVIEVADTLATTVTWARTADLQRDEPLVVMGFPVPDRTFKISTGQVVGFQPPSTREAIIANNPIDKGNSGGPALRRDGTVAGVVTEMATKTDDGARVAIVFTSSTVEATAERFIARPSDVLSSCGLGPDYVPPVPTDFDLPPASSFPAPPVQPDPADLPQTASTFPTVPFTEPFTTAPSGPTTTTLACPGERPSIRTDVVQVDPAGEPGHWRIQLQGTLGNNAATPIEVQRIDLALEGAPTLEAVGVPSANPVGPVSATAWSADTTVAADIAPTPTRVVLRWTWSDPAHARCPSPAAVWDIPASSVQSTDATTPV